MYSVAYLLPPPLLLIFASLARIPPSYFSAKNNIFNLFFVKLLWLWTTAAFVAIQPSAETIRRYTILTVYWVLFTQWCFGPPIIDRSFVITGGACNGYEAYSQLECRAAGRRWEGGHDISGHVFLLSLTSMALWLEISFHRREAALQNKTGLGGQEAAQENAGPDGQGGAQEKAGLGREEAWPVGTKFALGVSLLSMWMLMMTAAYFHTYFEKLTGLLVAYAGIVLAYGIPKLEI